MDVNFVAKGNDLVSELQSCFYNIATFMNVLEEADTDDGVAGNIGYVGRSLWSNGGDRLQNVVSELQDLLGEIRVRTEGALVGTGVKVRSVTFKPSKLIIDLFSGKTIEHGSHFVIECPGEPGTHSAAQQAGAPGEDPHETGKEG
jgi:hypothetical protein